MVFEALKNFEPYLAYQKMKALPPQVPPWEVKQVHTGWDAKEKKPGGEMKQGVSVVFGETYCRYPVLGGIKCGNRYNGRGALQFHIIHGHKSAVEGTKKGKPYGAEIIKVKNFYAKIAEYALANQRLKLAEDTAITQQAAEEAYDSGCDEDHTIHPELKRMRQHARDRAQEMTQADEEMQNDRTSAKTDWALLSESGLRQFHEDRPRVPCHCEPRVMDDLLLDKDGKPLLPCQRGKGDKEWVVWTAAAIRILRFLKINVGPCEACYEKKNTTKTCFFDDGCGSFSDFSDITFKPNTADWGTYKVAMLRRGKAQKQPISQ